MTRIGGSSPSLVWVNQFALLPGDGGGTRHFELSRELVQRGWRVTILASDLHLHARRFTRRANPRDRATVLETKDGVQVRWLWAAPYERNDWKRAWNWWTFQRSVMRERRSLDPPDIVIGSSPQIFAASAARALARRCAVPFVFEVRDLWPESLLAVGGRRGPGYHLIEHVARGLYRDADRVLVLARGVFRYLAEQGVPLHKLGHVPNGVDVRTFRPAEVQAPTLERRDLTLVYAGAHGPANGLECVLDAAQILGNASQVRFLLIGDGPSKAVLRKDAQQRGLTNVEFADPVAKHELLEHFRCADAGLMILRGADLFSFGVSPNKLFDYLAAGLPVICNVSGEVAEMLAESGAGVQVADAGGAALAQGIRRLHAMGPARRREIGALGRAWVEREHSRTVLGERLDAFLRGVLPR